MLGRFLLSGAFNTLLTYALYLMLLGWLGYRWSYAIAFAAGIVLAYALNRSFVFNGHTGWRSVVAMPLIYALQFVLGLAVVELWVALLQLPAAFAPLLAIAITVPCTYLLSRFAFVRR